jgi:hypothetical protein
MHLSSGRRLDCPLQALEQALLAAELPDEADRHAVDAFPTRAYEIAWATSERRLETKPQPAPQQRLYLRPERHQQGSLRPGGHSIAPPLLARSAAKTLRASPVSGS